MSVCEKVGELKRADVVNAIVKSAERELKQLRNLCGDAMSEESTVRAVTDPRWFIGTEGCRGSRMYRVVVPLSLGLKVFQEAELSHFLQYGSVRCHMRGNSMRRHL